MLWVTAERPQVDRLASAWLVRRFVDADAEFSFVPRGTEAAAVTDGTPFHLSGAELAQRAGRSTFEAILVQHALADDPVLARMGVIVRATDRLHAAVAFRGMTAQEALPADGPPEAPGLQAILHGVVLVSVDDLAALLLSEKVMNALYAALVAQNTSSSSPPKSVL